MQALLDILNHPAFPAAVLGSMVPFVYAFISKEGISLSPRLKFVLNVFLCSAVAMVPMLVRWKMDGLPPAEDFWASVTTALAMSETLYRMYLRPKQEAANA